MSQEWIKRNTDYTLTDGETGFVLNVAGMDFTEDDLNTLTDKFTIAHKEMLKIEAGEIKNPDENRKVTHFTDRIDYTNTTLFLEIENFVEDIRTGNIKSGTDKKFESVVINGIGGSALGPQLVQFAINSPYWNELNDEKKNGYLKIYFTDNTDTIGVSDILNVVDLETTLILSISKSGGTQETKNNIIAFKQAYNKLGLDFSKYACAITMKSSILDGIASQECWVKVFEMAESIGGRTSETSVVGHLPAALTGIKFKELIAGACYMDQWTREQNVKDNPAYLLAAMWYMAGQGKGNKNMVIVPYSDRLVLMSKYLQQLVMESVGKETDLDGNIVHQGLSVFGNKGGTDAHAFIQQLNDGRNDFFITFIEVLKDSLNIPIDKGVSMGDYLHGFQAGLSAALLDKGRQVISISINEVNEFNLGMIIALYERAVAVYAELINVNAFHQPGVQSYKLASKTIIDLIENIQIAIVNIKGFTGTATEIAAKLNLNDRKLEVEGILAKFAENSDNRTVNDCIISRTWNSEMNQWIYSVV